MNMEGRSTYTVKRLFSFEAAHQLDNHPTCSVLHGHGYRGEISVISASLSRDGFVIDFGVLKSLISQYDHGPVLKKTAEELAEEIGTAALEQLQKQGNGKDALEVKVLLWETPNACAEWTWHAQDQ